MAGSGKYYTPKQIFPTGKSVWHGVRQRDCRMLCWSLSTKEIHVMDDNDDVKSMAGCATDVKKGEKGRREEKISKWYYEEPEH